jgi:hypothetical protein
MPDARITSLLNAAKTDLDAASGSFAESFTSYKRYEVKWDVKELDDIHLTISPSGYETAPHSRGEDLFLGRVIFAIQQKLDGDDDAIATRIEELIYFQEQLYDWLNRRDLTGDWVFSEIVEVLPYSQEHLNTKRVYSGTIVVEYQKAVTV